MKYIVTYKHTLQNYINSSAGAHDENLILQELYSLKEVTCLKLSDIMYNIVMPDFGYKIVEVDEDLAIDGSNLFGEIRDVAKVFEAQGAGYSIKVPIEMTAIRKQHVVDFMRIFAKLFIKQEFDRRYKNMQSVSELEISTWEMQKHEAREFLTNTASGVVSKTPLLDHISGERNIDKTYLANKILEKEEQWKDTLSEVLVKYQILNNRFDSITNIKDMNVLFEDYFNIVMPISQAIELGRRTEDGTLVNGYTIKANQFNF